MNSNLAKLKEVQYSVIKDKNIAHQDFLYKLIIIGDTGKFPSFNPVEIMGKFDIYTVLCG
jgi:hypothetical protein